MLNVAEVNASIPAFLEIGTSVLTWLITSLTSVLNFMMETPVLAVFIVLTLIYAVIRIARRFVNV